MKKILCLFMLVVLLLSFTSCKEERLNNTKKNEVVGFVDKNSSESKDDKKKNFKLKKNYYINNDFLLEREIDEFIELKTIYNVNGKPANYLIIGPSGTDTGYYSDYDENGNPRKLKFSGASENITYIVYDMNENEIETKEYVKELINIINKVDKVCVLMLKSKNDSKITVNNNIIKLDVPIFYENASVKCSMLLNYNHLSDTFDATLKNMYAGADPQITILWKDTSNAILPIFKNTTTIKNYDSFIKTYEDINNWVCSSNRWKLSFQQEGYKINIDITYSDMRLYWTISAKK